MRDRVQQAFGCAVRNSYGASEFLSMGWECSAGHLHVNADWVILEAVDEHYRPVPAGELSSTVLLTNLANNVQPLIRYDLGDQVRMDAKPCSCGSPLPAIEVDGRHDDSLVMSGGRGKLVTLLPLALATVLEDQAGVFDFQLRQKDRTTVMLRLGLRGGDAAHAMERCRTVLQAFGRMHGIASLNVVAELEQPLLRGRSGKVCRVMGCKP
jgi:phenylacetate-coenzyme A ligase PaaK-like adenylate-forming protein